MEEHETISGEDAKRVLRGEEMKDCYNVTTIQRSEDDDMDKEIYEARYKKEKVEEKVEKAEEKKMTEELEAALETGRPTDHSNDVSHPSVRRF